jgi:hypothetical protein
MYNLDILGADLPILHESVAADGHGVAEEEEHDNGVGLPDLPPLQLEEGLNQRVLQQVVLARRYTVGSRGSAVYSFVLFWFLLIHCYSTV